jgi:hypothetical protein
MQRSQFAGGRQPFGAVKAAFRWPIAFACWFYFFSSLSKTRNRQTRKPSMIAPGACFKAASSH